jgi:1,4-alpha-glucan branching enzyme
VDLDLRLGAVRLDEGSCAFRVWAPRAEKVEVRLTAPGRGAVALEKADRGYHMGLAEGVGPGGTAWMKGSSDPIPPPVISRRACMAPPR